VPNLITDRPQLLAGILGRLNVRRLMYQSLIWSAVLRDHAGRLGSPLNAQDLQRAADALVDGMGRNPELCGDFLGRKMLVDQAQTIELALAQPSDALANVVSSIHAIEGHSRHPLTPWNPAIGSWAIHARILLS
jgi:hypothetical protein